MRPIVHWLVGCFLLSHSICTGQEKIFPGADETTPSRSEYFSWINNTNEGATEAQTLINLNFFKWLNDQFDMKLDIYSFDAGAIDGKGFYGNMHYSRFYKQFPCGFSSIANKAASMNTRLGLWCGPDGFGNSPEEEKQRTEMMVGLCRDFHFELFKMDAVCGYLRPEKYEAFNFMMTTCRKYSPDLVLLNHRLDLGTGMKHSTTFLLGGAETYIDVHVANTFTASHHRACVLQRELTPDLTRLAEDHGVCFSSCLDYWEDDLILQVFNRNLILSPEIYGNPWFLKDDEYPLLARIFNLHQKYKNILVFGEKLSEERYGMNSVSRGDPHVRLITLRNLSWEPVHYSLKLDSSIGLKDEKSTLVRVQTYHPTEKIIGNFLYGSDVDIEVLPFRVCLVKISNVLSDNEIYIEGIDYRILSNNRDKLLNIQLMALPGSTKKIKLCGNYSNFKSAKLEGKDISSILKGASVTIHFNGTKFKHPYHRKIGEMCTCPIPDDAESIYEATCFAANNNSLEARELTRSGKSFVPQVQAARDAFINQKMFKARETWDRYLFDGDSLTAFSVGLRRSSYDSQTVAFRLDIGKSQELDSLIIKTFDESSLQPLRSDEGANVMISNDINSWRKVSFIAGKSMKINLSPFNKIRYVKLQPFPLRISEIIGYKDGKQVDRSEWRASNLFRPYTINPQRKDLEYSAKKAWVLRFSLDEIPEKSYLCIAINGQHGIEGAYAGLKIDGKYYGCPDRAPSFKSNVWEASVKEVDKNYTYYFPLTKDMVGKEIEAYVLGLNQELLDLYPVIYITAYPIPFQNKNLVIN